MTHENLKGRVAVVTGGGGVLCGAFAKTLAKQNAMTATIKMTKTVADLLDKFNTLP